jgi:hypothetical protein
LSRSIEAKYKTQKAKLKKKADDFLKVGAELQKKDKDLEQLVSALSLSNKETKYLKKSLLAIKYDSPLIWLLSYF